MLLMFPVSQAKSSTPSRVAPLRRNIWLVLANKVTEFEFQYQDFDQSVSLQLLRLSCLCGYVRDAVFSVETRYSGAPGEGGKRQKCSLHY